MAYRVNNISLTVTHPGGGEARFMVASRNLSSGGMAFLHGGFLHTGTTVRVVLTTKDRQSKVILGEVRSCRHVRAHIHEVGVRFQEKIDLTQFCDDDSAILSNDTGERVSRELPTLRGNCLLLASNMPALTSLAKQLNNAGLNVIPVDSLGTAIDRVHRMAPTMALCELSSDFGPGDELIRSLVDAGMTGPVLAVLGDNKLDGARALSAGAKSLISLPINAEELMDVLAAHLESIPAELNAVYSELSNNPGAADLLTTFVEQVKQLSKVIDNALQSADSQALLKTCKHLKHVAPGYGFQVIADAARHAEAALGAASVQESAAQILALSDLCSRVTANPMPNGQRK